MKRLILIIFTVVGVGFLVWSFAFDGGKVTSLTFGDAARKTTSGIIDEATKLLETSKNVVEKTISTPPPLRKPLEEKGEELSIEGVLEWTNSHRAKEGLPPLTLNTSLSSAADLKVQDMFEQQYFAHVSPDDIGPSDLVDRAGYDYLAVGENLALGGYDDDADLVQAWMDSPGHRENILATSFSEIGISVQEGEYEGFTTWLAVQTFARPASDCTSPEESLNAQITTNKSKLEALNHEAETRLANIQSSPEPKNPGQVKEYNAKLDVYNEKVRQINELHNIIQGQITVYNGQVQAFNACVKN